LWCYVWPAYNFVAHLSPQLTASAHVAHVALQAFAQLAVRLLLHQLQESPTVLRASTAAEVLVPALGQMLTYSSAALQVGCNVSSGSIVKWRAVPLEQQGATAYSLSIIKPAALEGFFACTQQYSSTLQQYACSKADVRNATAVPVGHGVCFSKSVWLSVGCLQELCMGLTALLVLQQPHKAEMVPAAANHALWMLQCASQGQLPADLLCLGSMQALTACLSACTAALHGLGLLGLFADR
jgi:hypothetical protein